MIKRSVQGRVTNGDGRRPLPGVGVQLIHQPATGPESVIAGVEADAEGGFHLEGAADVAPGEAREGGTWSVRVILSEEAVLTAALSLRAEEHLVLLRVQAESSSPLLLLEDRALPGRLRLRGRVLFAEGSWGAQLPVRGAQVTLLDGKPDGSRVEIFSGQTNEEGVFAGLSTAWKESVQKATWDFQRGAWSTEDILMDGDILDLFVRVEGQGRQVEQPFQFVADDVQSIVRVPWEPHARDLHPIAAVNGEACYGTDVLARRLLLALSLVSQPLVVQCYGAVADALALLAREAETPGVLLNHAAPNLRQSVIVSTQVGPVALQDLALAAMALDTRQLSAVREICAILAAGRSAGRSLQAVLLRGGGVDDGTDDGAAVDVLELTLG